jgi:hypothetical protein
MNIQAGTPQAPRPAETLVASANKAALDATDLIRKTDETRNINGVEIVFQMAPNSEAPAEMHMYFPVLRALNMAENTTHLFHNLLPFRGAEVRDPLAWSKYINEALELFADRADVLMGQHHWPVWGTGRIKSYMTSQRDLYKYVHDQTLRLMNHGLTAPEIAEALVLPKSLAQEWQNRDYYGTVRHNAKAIYLSLGCRGDEQSGFCRAGQCRGARAQCRRFRAAGISVRSCHVAQRLSLYRAGAAQRRCRDRGNGVGQPGHAGGADH